MGMQVATVMALLVVLAATRADLRGGGSFEVTVAEQETVDLQEIVQTAQRALPPPPPRPPVPVVVADDEVLEAEPLNLDAMLDLEEAVAALPPPPPDEEEEATEPEVFVVVEEQPEIIGGVAELARAVQYPLIARQAGIEGMVVVKVVVTAEGAPRDPTVLRSPSEVLNEAAIEAVMKQRFKPGRQRGRPVAVEIAIPVRFQLSEGVVG